MKFTVDVDCTPEEARRFLGLPDVTALQEEAMSEIRKRMLDAIQKSDPESLMKAWMPLTMPAGMPGAMPGAMPDAIPGLEQMQKMFWSQFAQAGDNKTSKDKT
ncbi:DUF6489 family protein [Kiloniella laminariae]|uniref:DUF6489 family protein n=1 Tax=Kiloniella laminariae TaxID=454162 RepID=UPI0004759D9C|nr:DUF6489 family protein [Kiloniella laminariae]